MSLVGTVQSTQLLFVPITVRDRITVGLRVRFSTHPQSEFRRHKIHHVYFLSISSQAGSIRQCHRAKRPFHLLQTLESLYHLYREENDKSQMHPDNFRLLWKKGASSSRIIRHQEAPVAEGETSQSGF
ncbi:unnamed protein product [Caenorhabditis nigoni]